MEAILAQAELTCPNCKGLNKMEIPQDICLAFYVCSNCNDQIGMPEDSELCCVICAYSEAKCPVSVKH